MYVKAFDCIQVGSFSVAVYYLHDFIQWSEGVSRIVDVFGKAVVSIVFTEGSSVFLVPCRKFSAGVTDLGLVAVKAGEFVCSGLFIGVLALGYVGE
jgi:hypothetical protein